MQNIIQKQVTSITKINEPILVEADGEWKVAITVIDKAGNKSDTKTTIVKKDTISPDEPTLTFKSNTQSSITVDSIGNDNQSGIWKYIFEYREIREATTIWHKLENAEVESESGKCTYTYNVPRGEYSLRVTVKDKAGNKATSKILNTNTVLNTAPVFSGTPTVSKVSNSNTSLTITARATDVDGGNLTYTLYTIDGSGNETVATNVDQNPKTASSGTGVTFTKSGLGNYSTNSFKVKVTDGIDTTPSSTCSGTTYCKGTYCSGGGSTNTKCGTCKGTGYVSSSCKGSTSYTQVWDPPEASNHWSFRGSYTSWYVASCSVCQCEGNRCE